MKCRNCLSPLSQTFLDLGFAPPSNAYLTTEQLTRSEKYYPLKIRVCDHCWLVQTEDFAQADEFFCDNYAYFSSTSSSWLSHASRYVESIISKLCLDQSSLVIEVASNDGYLLRNFMTAGIPCIGIEPTASTADVAEELGIHVIREFFGELLAKRLATQGHQADLLIGNNVYAHVPDINDFTRGLKVALKPGGVITLEFPHLMRLIEKTQFDTVYHEHFSYLSLDIVSRIFDAAGLRVFDVLELPTHGGSLRVFGCHEDDKRETSLNVAKILSNELAAGLHDITSYHKFQHRANQIKNNFLSFLISQHREGKKIVAYGAAAKGNTLLNYAGVKPDLISFVCDAASSKQGNFMPGSHIPILSPQAIRQYQPDFIVILPWNIVDEVISLTEYSREWGCKFVTAIPELCIF